MSDNRHYKGKLIEVKPLNNENLESLCKRILDTDKLSKYYDCYADELTDMYYQEYYIRNDKLFKIEKKEYNPSEIFNINKISESEYEFETMYYDGGCCLEEALDECFKRSKL
ncbi:MAG: hypothetical protein ACRDD7_13930 [Peptostreptococcaceae bacterium]